MQKRAEIGRHEHLTFKGNLRRTRYGWLRLTPAYSVHQVEELLGDDGEDAVVLDPFCGTGTTALVCAGRGIACDTTDINPFLIWLAEVKAAVYQPEEVEAFLMCASRVADAIRTGDGTSWVPALHQIEKWWDKKTLAGLARAMAVIRDLDGSAPPRARDLLRVAYCQTMMEHAHVSFGHQSMSFKRRKAPPEAPASLFGPADHPVGVTWDRAAPVIAAAARSPIRRLPRALLLDARCLEGGLEANRYTRVVTSPPYCNRMSYIRELRPYMYWLGFLKDGRAAGELDWQAIGGTWGCATSNVGKWQPEPGASVPYPGFEHILQKIAARSDVLARYVHKYFHDMAQHCAGLFQCVRPGGTVHYVVGNSKFYDVMLPAQEILAALFSAAGFADAAARTTRKRTSKKELFEYIVSARKPAEPPYIA